MKAYFQVHNISYTLASVVEKDKGRYEIVEWSSSTEQAFKEQLKYYDFLKGVETHENN